MKTLFTFLFSVFFTVGQAQYAGGGTPTASPSGSNFNSQAKQTISIYLGSMNESEVKRKDDLISKSSGSPYINNKFAPTTLFYNDEKIGSIFYRHNALNEEIEIMKANVEGELVKSLARDKNINIRVNGKKMSFKTFITVKNRTTNGYLTQLIKGDKYDLHKRTLVKFTEGTPAQNSFVAAVPARFTQFTEYYYQKNGVNRIDELVTKNSKLLKLLSDNEKVSTKTYIKENNLNIKKESDLIKVFEFLNSK